MLVVLANLSGEAVTLSGTDVPDLGGSEVLLPTHPRDTDAAYDLTLQPWESRIHRL